jgi:hypothetical protein
MSWCWEVTNSYSSYPNANSTNGPANARDAIPTRSLGALVRLAVRYRVQPRSPSLVERCGLYRDGDKG